MQVKHVVMQAIFHVVVYINFSWICKLAWDFDFLFGKMLFIVSYFFFFYIYTFLKRYTVARRHSRHAITKVYTAELFILVRSSRATIYNMLSEAATETIFENICSFLPGAPFSGVFQEALCVHRTDANFPGRFVCSPNRYKFSRRMWSVHRTDTTFPGALFMCSPNRYRFSRTTFLATEQIPIFQEPSLCVHRTDTNFPGAPF